MSGSSTPAGALDASLLKTTLKAEPGVLPPSSELVFGKTMSDHMLVCQWTEDSGFGIPEIKPYGPLSIDPASTVLHYAPTLFEGMKAYKDVNGVARLFRPNKVRNETALSFAEVFAETDRETSTEHGAHEHQCRSPWLPHL